MILNCPQKHKQSGATLIEATFALPIFFSVLFGFAYLILFLCFNLIVDYSLYRGIRAGLQQAALGIPVVTALENEIANSGNIFGITILPGDINICPQSKPGCSPNEVGFGGTFFTVTVRYTSFLGRDHKSDGYGIYL